VRACRLVRLASCRPATYPKVQNRKGTVTMTLQDIAKGISDGLQGKSFDGSLKFDCGDDGVIILADGAASTTDRDTDCTIKLSQDNLVKLLKGKLNPMTGVMMGKLKISGDMATAMKLGKLIG
jgi:putative sterol carrier protein